MCNIAVAPLVGAWIEILMIWFFHLFVIGRSSRGSVDWNQIGLIVGASGSVAPLVGAWIEITETINYVESKDCRSSRGSVDWNIYSVDVSPHVVLSLLSWERGLKLIVPWFILLSLLSLLSWERGLKFDINILFFIQFRRSSRGSVDWNLYIIHLVHLFSVAPLVGAWIEIQNKGKHYSLPFIVAPLVGAWIEISSQYPSILTHSCRSSRGSVDWNSGGYSKTHKAEVAPLVGAWIEIPIHECWRWWIWSLLSWERGLKYTTYVCLIMTVCVAPLVGAWIEI